MSDTAVNRVPTARVSPEETPLEPVGRALGVPALGEAPWGSHFCLFFAGPEDLLDVLVPHVRAGLANNEICTVSTFGQLDLDAFLAALAADGDDVGRRIDEGQLILLSTPPPRVEGGQPDCDRLLNGIVGRVHAARDRGYTGYRGFGLASWLERPDWAPYMTYEGELTGALAGERGLATCAYPLERCDAAQLVDVLMTHQFALLRHRDWTLIEPTERKQATEVVARMNVALAERTAELQTALADLNGFSRWVTHDLRAPLASITAYGAQLADVLGGRLDERERAMLERIQDSAGWMERLVGEVLTYSQVQHAELRIRPVDLRAVVTQAWTTVVRGRSGPRVTLRLDQLPPAYADHDLLGRVFEALLANAVTATAHRPDPLVEVSATQDEDGGVTCSVRDNGVGFDRDHAEVIFDAFTRLRSADEPAATGLGLAVVREIVTRHGGRVRAEGEPGAGATVSFTLPPPRRPAPAS